MGKWFKERGRGASRKISDLCAVINQTLSKQSDTLGREGTRAPLVYLFSRNIPRLDEVRFVERAKLKRRSRRGKTPRESAANKRKDRSELTGLSLERRAK